ncbi:MAG: tRNA (5-methylaminomethyl-2-thiouridine)(34)-methyltransferase MnmD [Saprospirales bacterium]|jgi:tRNA U34 5-methylaminomethyl-2-thiouridine-forming methyltransferase MnmC|nr:tRNA (5-methylaminomethyl-2-thiouridine)(34)-methyltransferase MnmD [Saprospirales bacterium]
MEDELIVTSDGSHTVLSAQFGESYHSRFGAVQESRHIFIDAALKFKALQQTRIKVLEMGFGTGLNALLTLLESRRKGLEVDYSSVEAYPISPEQARSLNFIDILQEPWLGAPFSEMHTGPWGQAFSLDEHFVFTKWRSLFEEFAPPSQYDVIYFDAFAPAAQPELWELPLLGKMYDALLPGGVLTTYCAKGSVKRNLKSLGFTLESLEGPPGKREMTRATKG